VGVAVQSNSDDAQRSSQLGWSTSTGEGADGGDHGSQRAGGVVGAGREAAVA
jgi:hypothetical protein